MTPPTLKQKLVMFDNRITFIVGYRNLFNIAVLFCCSWFFAMAEGGAFPPEATPTVIVGIFIVLVLGLKWSLMQIRENIDATAVRDALTSEE